MTEYIKGYLQRSFLGHSYYSKIASIQKKMAFWQGHQKKEDRKKGELDFMDL